MNTTGTMEGNCLCGAVSIKVKASNAVQACHCGMCRRWKGGPLLALQCGSSIQISGKDQVSTFASSEWAERAFCRTCGTHLYYRFKQANAHSVSVGLFQDQSQFEFDEQIFIDRKPAWYEFSNKTAVLTEAEVFQKFAPK